MIRIAVVGHPNRGKSSLVSALLHNNRIAISPLSGTTLQAETYQLNLDGHCYLELVDTPGFQRARQLLANLGQQPLPLSSRPVQLAQFLASEQARLQFPDECQLLAPIMQGAGILYVVDADAEISDQDRAEMELLLWTGAPRMAVINPFAQARHQQQWQQLLAQHFGQVLLFNPMQAQLEKSLSLLQAMSYLQPDWQQPLQRAQQALRSMRASQWRQSALRIAQLLQAMLSLRLQRAQQPNEAELQAWQERYGQELQALEAKARHDIEQLWHFDRLERQELPLLLQPESLFSNENWQLFGLTAKQLTLASASAGAMGGAALDLATAGHSLLLGSIVGGGMGALGGWWSGKKLAKLRLGLVSLGNSQWQIGPIKDPNFGFVVLGRALAHLRLLSQRSHARRDALSINASWQQQSIRQQGQWLYWFSQLRKGKQPEAMLSALEAELVSWQALQSAPQDSQGSGSADN